jgi:cytoskeleton protein RodZ
VASLQEVGQRLKQAREAQGLSLDEISARTRITVRHLKALEEGAEGELPEVFYVRGFLKKYAEVVGLSPGDVADAYRSAPVPTAPLPDLRQGPGRLGYYLVIAALLIGLLALAWYFQPRVSVVEAPTATSSPEIAGSSLPTVSPSPASAVSAEPVSSAVPVATGVAAVPTVVPSPSPSPVPTARTQVVVALKWVGRSWVEVRVDGKLVLEGILSSGASRQFTGREIEVSAGNAGGLKVDVDGKELGLFGKYGEVVSRTYRAQP